MRIETHVDGKDLGVEWYNREMIKIEQGTSFDSKQYYVITSLTTAEIMTGLPIIVIKKSIYW